MFLKEQFWLPCSINRDTSIQGINSRENVGQSTRFARLEGQILKRNCYNFTMSFIMCSEILSVCATPT